MISGSQFIVKRCGAAGQLTFGSVMKYPNGVGGNILLTGGLFYDNRHIFGQFKGDGHGSNAPLCSLNANLSLIKANIVPSLSYNIMSC